jgi:hypothetical protein
MATLYLDPTGTKILANTAGTKLMAECCCAYKNARCQWIQEWTFECLGGCDPNTGAWVDGYIHEGDTPVPVPAWAASTLYAAADRRVYDGQQWLCIEGHTSGETFDETKWTTESGWYKWSDPYCVSYAPGEAHHAAGYEYVDATARCTVLEYGAASEADCDDPCPDEELVGVTPPSLGTTDLCGANGYPANSECDCRVPEWEAETSYILGSVVWYGGVRKQCVETHTSGEEFDPEKWSAAPDREPVPCTLNLTIENVPIFDGAESDWLNGTYTLINGAETECPGQTGDSLEWGADKQRSSPHATKARIITVRNNNQGWADNKLATWIVEVWLDSGLFLVIACSGPGDIAGWGGRCDPEGVGTKVWCNFEPSCPSTYESGMYRLEAGQCTLSKP